MLGLRYFACDRCETVYAAPETPPRCANCTHGSFDEITETLQNASYFYSPSVHENAN